MVVSDFNPYAHYCVEDNPNARVYVEEVVRTGRAVSYDLFCRQMGLDPITPREDAKFAVESHVVDSAPDTR